ASKARSTISQQLSSQLYNSFILSCGNSTDIPSRQIFQTYLQTSIIFLALFDPNPSNIIDTS
ncbi:3882_t:CDS:1, partial [Ambispora leptoticha]